MKGKIYSGPAEYNKARPYCVVYWINAQEFTIASQHSKRKAATNQLNGDERVMTRAELNREIAATK